MTFIYDRQDAIRAGWERNRELDGGILSNLTTYWLRPDWRSNLVLAAGRYLTFSILLSMEMKIWTCHWFACLHGTTEGEGGWLAWQNRDARTWCSGYTDGFTELAKTRLGWDHLAGWMAINSKNMEPGIIKPGGIRLGKQYVVMIDRCLLAQLILVLLCLARSATQSHCDLSYTPIAHQTHYLTVHPHPLQPSFSSIVSIVDYQLITARSLPLDPSNYTSSNHLTKLNTRGVIQFTRHS